MPKLTLQDAVSLFRSVAEQLEASRLPASLDFRAQQLDALVRELASMLPPANGEAWVKLPAALVYNIRQLAVDASAEQRRDEEETPEPPAPGPTMVPAKHAPPAKPAPRHLPATPRPATAPATSSPGVGPIARRAAQLSGPPPAEIRPIEEPEPDEAAHMPATSGEGDELGPMPPIIAVAAPRAGSRDPWRKPAGEFASMTADEYEGKYGKAITTEVFDKPRS